MDADAAGSPRTDSASLRAVTAAAADLFTAAARKRAAFAYLHQRGIDTATLTESWVLGYAPPGWTRLVDMLAGRYGEQTLLDAGLARRCSRGTLIDTFRDRVVFGVRDATGTVAGFTGRDLSGNPDVPKYLNTHRHPLFDKGSLLFGLSEGTHPCMQQPVIVEGPLDVLAIASRLDPDRRSMLPVAACGTAFTAQQARQVAVVAFAHQAPVVIAMDGDSAGRAAALQVGERLHATGVNVRIAYLPAGSDPAAYLSRPGSTLDPFRADHAVPLLTVQVEHAIAAQGDHIQWIEGRLAALRTVAGHLATYPPSHTARQIGWLADTLDLHPSTVTTELADAYRGRVGAGSGSFDANSPARRPISTPHAVRRWHSAAAATTPAHDRCFANLPTLEV